ncbi:MAG TPA: beta-ketoacyl-[acyl-carrier-protein] synthase II, partial [Clostridiales bacterium]|nr:beta-ketoacyl-[acyl-carrier-protein] synthase II [Clostridiales bacterium]
MKKRVVVTGMGAITPLGCTVDSFWRNICRGTNGIDIITRFDVDDFSAKIAAEVNDFDPVDHMDKKEAKRMDRYTQYALAASGMAVNQAGFDKEKIDQERFGVILGSGVGGIETMENQGNVLYTKGPGRISPYFVPMMIGNMAAGQISIAYGAKGPNITVVTACASASNAIGEAYRSISHGYADVIITGGSEAPITPLALAGFCSMRALSTRNDDPKTACRPFDL